MKSWKITEIKKCENHTPFHHTELCLSARAVSAVRGNNQLHIILFYASIKAGCLYGLVCFRAAEDKSYVLLHVSP